MPLKIILFLPCSILLFIGILTGYEEPMDIGNTILFEKWFDFD